MADLLNDAGRHVSRDTIAPASRCFTDGCRMQPEWWVVWWLLTQRQQTLCCEGHAIKLAEDLGEATLTPADVPCDGR